MHRLTTTTQSSWSGYSFILGRHVEGQTIYRRDAENGGEETCRRTMAGEWRVNGLSIDSGNEDVQDRKYSQLYGLSKSKPRALQERKDSTDDSCDYSESVRGVGLSSIIVSEVYVTAKE